MTPRVVVTGLGAISAAGNTAEATWQAMLEGRSGAGPITLFDPEPYPIRIQAEVKEFELPASVDQKQQRHMNRGVQFAISSVMEALADSGLEINEENADDIAVVYGSGGGGYDMLLDGQKTLDERGIRRITPFLVANFVPDAASGHIAISTGARGHNIAVVSACATGGSSIGEGFEVIRRGDAVAAITGASEAVLLPIFHATWTSMRALADDEDPKKAQKPFDLNRSGFVPGEGGATLILEDYEHAKARGANMIAEVIGYGASNDAFDMIGVHETGRGLRRAVLAGIRKAGIDATEVDYVNPHGTGTRLNDKVETAVLKEVMGEGAYDMAISSTKPITGHCMGAAGAIEAVAAVLAIRDQRVPPTINYATPDPECDLDYVPNEARSMDVRVSMSTSVGLGGHNSCLIFRAIS